MKHHRDPETRRGADERELHIGPEPDDDVGPQGGIGAERRDEATLLAGEVEQRGHDGPRPLRSKPVTSTGKNGKPALGTSVPSRRRVWPKKRTAWPRSESSSARARAGLTCPAVPPAAMATESLSVMVPLPIYVCRRARGATSSALGA